GRLLDHQGRINRGAAWPAAGANNRRETHCAKIDPALSVRSAPAAVIFTEPFHRDLRHAVHGCWHLNRFVVYHGASGNELTKRRDRARKKYSDRILAGMLAIEASGLEHMPAADRID